MLKLTEIIPMESDDDSTDRADLPFKQNVDKRIAKINRCVQDAEDSLYVNDSAAFDLYTSNLYKECFNLTEAVKQYSYSLGSSEGYRIAIEECVNVTFDMKDKIGHLTFSSLLPDLPKNSNYVSSAMYAGSVNAMNKTLSSNCNGIVFREKVILYFIHHYADEHEMKDHDNFYIKPIIDTICSYMLIDDGPMYCSYYMDCKMDSSTYSEIYIVPFSEKDRIFTL